MNMPAPNDPGSTRCSARTRSTRWTPTNEPGSTPTSSAMPGRATRSTSCSRARRRSRSRRSTTRPRRPGSGTASRPRSRPTARSMGRSQGRDEFAAPGTPRLPACAWVSRWWRRGGDRGAVVLAQVVSLHNRLDDAGTGEKDAEQAFVRPAMSRAPAVALKPAHGAEVARVVLLPDGSGYLKSDGLAPLDAAHTYQLWAVTGNAADTVVISAGVLGPHPQAAAFRAPTQVDGFAITVERSPGVAQSSQAPYASASFDVTWARLPSRRWAVPVDVPGAFVFTSTSRSASRCDYCDFATWTDRDHLIDAYVDACVTDLARRRNGVPAATSVFFGGGTPSLSRATSSRASSTPSIARRRRGDRRVQPRQRRRRQARGLPGRRQPAELRRAVDGAARARRARAHARSRERDARQSRSRATRASSASASI